MSIPAPTVQEHMTHGPLTISSTATLADAAKVMRTRVVRHLPVLSKGSLVGILSERDVHVARTLRSVPLTKAPVALVMVEHPVTVAPDTLLSDAAARMIDRKAGSAVVVHEGKVVGIFTTHDALHALHRVLAAHEVPAGVR